MQKTKIVEIKQGNKTLFRTVPIDWKPEDGLLKRDILTGDLTTGNIKFISLGISKEKHKKIFGNNENEKDYTKA